MATKEVYVCDGEHCGKLLLEPKDGFVLFGELATAVRGGEVSILKGADRETAGVSADPISLCKECLLGIIQHGVDTGIQEEHK